MELSNTLTRILLFGFISLISFNCDSDTKKKKKKVSKSNVVSSGGEAVIDPNVEIVTDQYQEENKTPPPAPDPKELMYNSLNKSLDLPMLNSSIIGVETETILQEMHSKGQLTNNELDAPYYSYYHKKTYTLRELIYEIYYKRSNNQPELKDELNKQLNIIRETNNNKAISHSIVNDLQGDEKDHLTDEKFEILLRICKLININTVGVKTKAELVKIFVEKGGVILRNRLKRKSLHPDLQYQRYTKRYTYKGLIRQLCIYQIISVSDMFSYVINTKKKEKGYWESIFNRKTSINKFYSFNEEYSRQKRQILYRLNKKRFEYEGTEPMTELNHEELLLDVLTGKYFAKLIGEISHKQGLNNLNLCRFYYEEKINGQCVQKRLDDKWVRLLINEYGQALNQACS